MAQHGSEPDRSPVPGRPPVRASDAERQTVADVLRQHTTDGRLTIDEYEQRVDAALSARTVAELRPLLADLPVAFDEVLPAHRPPQPAVGYPQPANAGQGEPPGRWMMRPVLFVLAILMLVGGLAAVSRGALGAFPLLLFGIFIIGGGRDRGHRRRF
ncbi:DUF1707 domain-containing protein [Cryptosporangium sp. NPDC051539]|uniref:DUF1707 domain-containing protein n=1 Tax=Cryptosporangium sp. NPDC051539 TaxID=3363962 RepID=UPI00379033D0